MAEVDVRRRESEDRAHRRRSVLVSPLFRFSPAGSRWGGFSLSFNQLRQLAKLSPTVQSIIHLRATQVASFARKPRHKGDRGFEIVRADDPSKKTAHDEKILEYCFNFLMKTGDKKDLKRPNLVNYIKMAIDDVHIIGAATTELVFNEDGRLSEFWSMDAATIEKQLAERYIPTTRYGKLLDQPVSYVQVIDGQIETEYAEDELIYMSMFPITDIQNGGYARSYTESAADWIAAEVLALQYNANYFDHGSVPPGILALIGDYNEETLEDLNRMWETDTKGVIGQHKPIALAVQPSMTGSSSINWIPMKNSNREMEMGDFLDKLTTKISSVFLTDPTELGQRSAGNKDGMSASDNTEAKIDLSRDKGLLPLLDLVELTINEQIMPHLAPGYVFRFTGINAEDEKAKVDFLNEQKGITYREWRKAMGLDEIPEGGQYTKWLDAPLDPFAQQIWLAESGIGAPVMSEGGEDEQTPAKQGEGTQKANMKPIQMKKPKLVKPMQKSWRSLRLEA